MSPPAPVILLQILARNSDARVSISLRKAAQAVMVDPITNLGSAIDCNVVIGETYIDNAESQYERNRSRDQLKPSSYLARPLAPAQGVKPDPQNAGNQFKTCVRTTVLAVACVGRKRNSATIANPAVGINRKAKRGRKAFEQAPLRVIRSVRLAIDDQRKYLLAASQRLEGADLLVYPGGCCRVGRTDDD